MSTLPMNVVTLLSPNSKLPGPMVFSKKFGDQPKSNSKPTTLGFQPMVAPKSTRCSTSSSKSPAASLNVTLPPKFPPTNGVKNQPCARAVAGTSNSASALMKSSLRNCIGPPPLAQEPQDSGEGVVQGECPAHEIARLYREPLSRSTT